MGIHRFEIDTYKTFQRPIVEFKKMILDDNNDKIHINPNDNSPFVRDHNVTSININEIIYAGENTNIREYTKSIKIVLIPDWVESEDNFYNNIYDYIHKMEDPNNTLTLSIRLICPKLNYLIESKYVPLNEVTDQNDIVFKRVKLDDLTEKIKIESEIIRRSYYEGKSKQLKAVDKYSILGENDPIHIYIDPIKNVGRNYLDINPKELGDKMFEFDLNEFTSNEPPKLFYNNKFRYYFANGDNYESVKVILSLIAYNYFHKLLEWIVFKNPSFEDKNNSSIIKLICLVCDIRQKELQDLSEMQLSPDKHDKYIDVSQNLFNNIQTQEVSWKKLFYNLIKTEQTYYD